MLALKAYLGGKLEYKMTGGGNLSQKKTELKDLIQLARDEAGYQPGPTRWPRSKRLVGGVVMLYFDAREDGNTSRKPCEAEGGKL